MYEFNVPLDSWGLYLNNLFLLECEDDTSIMFTEMSRQQNLYAKYTL